MSGTALASTSRAHPAKLGRCGEMGTEHRAPGTTRSRPSRAGTRGRARPALEPPREDPASSPCTSISWFLRARGTSRAWHEPLLAATVRVHVSGGDSARHT